MVSGPEPVGEGGFAGMVFLRIVIMLLLWASVEFCSTTGPVWGARINCGGYLLFERGQEGQCGHCAVGQAMERVVRMLVGLTAIAADNGCEVFLPQTTQEERWLRAAEGGWKKLEVQQGGLLATSMGRLQLKARGLAESSLR